MLNPLILIKIRVNQDTSENKKVPHWNAFVLVALFPTV